MIACVAPSLEEKNRFFLRGGGSVHRLEKGGILRPPRCISLCYIPKHVWNFKSLFLNGALENVFKIYFLSFYFSFGKFLEVYTNAIDEYRNRLY